MKLLFSIALFFLGLTVTTFSFLGAINVEKFGYFSFTQAVSRVDIQHEVGKFSFRLKANHAGLGIIRVRFLKIDKKNKVDLQLIVRNVEGDRTYQTQIPVNSLNDNVAHPFDIPFLESTSGTNFEVSIGGDKNNLTITPENTPVVEAIFFTDKDETIKKPEKLLAFLIEKVSFGRLQPEFWTILTIHLLILLLLITSLFSNKYLISILLISIVAFIESSWVYRSLDTVYLLILFLSLVIASKNNLESKVFLYLSLLFLFASFFSFSNNDRYSKFINWSLIFLIGFLVDRLVVAIFSRKRLERKLILKNIFDLASWTDPFYYLRTIVFMNSKVKPEVLELVVELDRKLRITLQQLIKLFVSIATIYWLYRMVDDAKGFYLTYSSYFPNSALFHYLSQTGIYLIPLYTSTILFSFVILYKLRRPILNLLFVAFMFYLAGNIFSITTPFKYQVKIWNVRPNSSQEPWVDVTIDGRNFGEKPFVGSVFINGVEQRVIDWSDKQVIFRTNPVVTKSGRLTVLTSSGKESNDIEFNYFGNR